MRPPREPGLDPRPSSSFRMALTNSSRLWAQADRGPEKEAKRRPGGHEQGEGCTKIRSEFFVHASSCTYIHTYAHAQSGKEMHERIRSDTCYGACLQTRRFLLACTHIWMCIQSYACEFTCAHALAHARMHIIARTQTHTTSDRACTHALYAYTSSRSLETRSHT